MSKHFLDRNDMLAVLRTGGSLLHNGRSIVDEKDLPTEAELAATPEDAEKAGAGLQAQIDALQAQLDLANAKKAPKQAEKPAEAGDEKPELDDEGNPVKK